ncbi:MAG TPA: hypothetical protein VGP64_04345 [Polyangia bacterium]|jgi:hypothetical protein
MSSGAETKRTGEVVEGTVLRSSPFPVLPWVSATLVDLTAAILLCGHPTTWTALLAGALHLAAMVPIVASPALASSERTLGLAFVFALPLLGPALAALSLGTEGQGELIEADPAAAVAVTVEAPRAEELRQLGEALPTCEALLAGNVDERRAIVATLALRADAGAVALLRWALGAANPELAVEAALAIEEMTASVEARLDGYRKMLAAGAKGDTALAAAELATDAIEAGLAETALIPTLAGEARGYYAAAQAGEGARAATIAIGRARLELAVLHPDAALEAIDEVVATGGEAPASIELASVEGVEPAELEMLLALRDEAVLATHTLPWESASALASYHPASPPPLIRRRLSAARRLSGLHVRGATGATGATGSAAVTVGVVQIPAPARTREVPIEKP